MALSSDNIGGLDLEMIRRIAPPESPGRVNTRSTFHLSRVTWRSLAVVEIPLLALSILVFAISVLVKPSLELRVAGIDLPSLYTCPFFALTGIPCLLCGMTRSFMAMGSLDVGQAFIFHPLGPFLFLMMAGLAIVLGISLESRRRFSISMGAALRRRLLTWGSLILLMAWVIKVAVWRQTGLL